MIFETLFFIIFTINNTTLNISFMYSCPKLKLIISFAIAINLPQLLPIH